jgi:hypothetical protein
MTTLTAVHAPTATLTATHAPTATLSAVVSKFITTDMTGKPIGLLLALTYA